jgi:polar amino acid transport system substrate-binding protein
VADTKEFLGDDLKVYASSLNMYQDLRNGRLDVATDSYGSAAYTVGEDFEVEVAEPFEQVAASLEGGQTTFPMTKDNQEMFEAFNEHIAEMHESGEMAEILEANGLDGSAAETGEPRLIE